MSPEVARCSPDPGRPARQVLGVKLPRRRREGAATFDPGRVRTRCRPPRPLSDDELSLGTRSDQHIFASALLELILGLPWVALNDMVGSTMLATVPTRYARIAARSGLTPT